MHLLVVTWLCRAQQPSNDYHPVCWPDLPPACAASLLDASITKAEYSFFGWAVVDPCAAMMMTKVMNMRDVQLALGAIQPSEATRGVEGVRRQGPQLLKQGIGKVNGACVQRAVVKG